ncbi:inorganic diphosphatase [Rapidithrix thailandica]|uniref:Inorganic pyrophosphatase n=1 Tax=Rapidithrix thailandica TaxID=413964 RepID=A0AAW9S093_9BACT
MKYNPWHDIPTGDKAPEIVNGIIEIPKGSRAKYELDKENGILKLDRVLYSAHYYPHNYGFIPQTLGEDNDPLDILVLSQISLEPFCIIPSRIIGVMRMQDGGDADDKIIAVADTDMSVSHIKDVSEMPTHFRRELKNFFEDYKKLENKTVVVEEIQSREVAIQILNEGIEQYKKTFGN